MIGQHISHPTEVFSSRLILPHVETVLTHSKCVLLLEVVGGGLVVVDDEHPPPLVLARSKHAVPSCVRGGRRAVGAQCSSPAWGRRGGDSGCQSEPLAGGPMAWSPRWCVCGF